MSRDLGISSQSVYTRRGDGRTASTTALGLSSGEQAELEAVRRCISQLEAELAATRCTTELLKAAVPPKAARGDPSDGRGRPMNRC